MAETPPRGPNDNESDKRALDTIRRPGETPDAKLNNRLTSTIPKKVGVTGDPPILPHFHPLKRASRAGTAAKPISVERRKASAAVLANGRLVSKHLGV
jgi:hypothetical protein